mmetsp:Transcript_43874/g.121417  ORF Transcript_43874/g.121417 Transcript_43874/m.121417 type:complete len:152 (+) Transcript_43874:66-521(+)|eukprot:CAMPEP_0117556380 /NCGR_PEP_ID=MMETSP0784-20121206/51778_1 /TAXON_ID=39447 /ORGANISM="" /LENGTH=151 /DNA_ID=CAMNT_0005353651 /DNA_START=66 /DNA_END=521 /DNA_ORIENTATION=-
MFGRRGVLCLALWLMAVARGGLSVDVSWTSYSDQADLPMSSQWREDMKAKLRSVDTSALTPKQKMQYKLLWRKLNGGETAGDDTLSSSYLPLALLVVGGVVLYVALQGGAASATMTSGATKPIAARSGGSPAHVDMAARDARLRKFSNRAS